MTHDDRVGRAGETVVVSPMEHRHLRQVLHIEEQVYPRPWSERLFRGELAMAGSRVYAVATVDGVVVGYAGALYVADEAHVTTVAVDPAWQRRAVGTRLILLLVRQTIDRGGDKLTLEVRMSNAGARELYRRFGFAPGGVRRNYYPETNEDALVMWAHDLQSDEYAARLRRIEAGLPGPTTFEKFASAEDTMEDVDA